MKRKVEGSEWDGVETRREKKKAYSGKVIGREFKSGRSEMSYYNLQPVSPSCVTNPDLTNFLRIQCKPAFSTTMCLCGQLLSDIGSLFLTA